MFTFFLVVHALIAAALVTVILMQRSEGGGLGMGGSPSGLMSARGAADFLTRATTVLATIFVVMSIGLAALATVQGGPRKIDASLARPAGPAPIVPAAPAAPAPGSAVPFEGDPLAGAAAAVPGAGASRAAGEAAPLTSPRSSDAPRETSRTRPAPTATPRPSEGTSTPAPAAAAPAPASSEPVPPAARPNSPSVPGAIETAPTGNASAPQ